MSRWILALLFAFGSVTFIAGCEEKAADKPADKVGDAADKAGDAADKAGDKAGDAADKAGDAAAE